MKVIIAGSRGITEYEPFAEELDSLVEDEAMSITEVVSGTARGVDQMGERWAKERGIPVKRFPADWERYGKSAGYRRNEQMALYADGLIAFWDGESRGTKHMIDLAKEHLAWHVTISVTTLGTGER